MKLVVAPAEGNRTSLGDKIFVSEGPRSGLEDARNAKVRPTRSRPESHKVGGRPQRDLEAVPKFWFVEGLREASCFKLTMREVVGNLLRSSKEIEPIVRPHP